jgi:hypothetical protein
MSSVPVVSPARQFDQLQPESIAADKLRGVPAIAEYIGEPVRRTYYLLDRRLLPGGKEGSIWIASRSALSVHYRRLTGANAGA